jgi:hypothetical protein
MTSSTSGHEQSQTRQTSLINNYLSTVFILVWGIEKYIMVQKYKSITFFLFKVGIFSFFAYNSGLFQTAKSTSLFTTTSGQHNLLADRRGCIVSVPSSELGPPPFPPQASMPPSLKRGGGGGNTLGGVEMGGPSSDDWKKAWHSQYSV